MDHVQSLIPHVFWTDEVRQMPAILSVSEAYRAVCGDNHHSSIFRYYKNIKMNHRHKKDTKRSQHFITWVIPDEFP